MRYSWLLGCCLVLLASGCRTDDDETSFDAREGRMTATINRVAFAATDIRADFLDDGSVHFLLTGSDYSLPTGRRLGIEVHAPGPDYPRAGTYGTATFCRLRVVDCWFANYTHRIGSDSSSISYVALPDNEPQLDLHYYESSFGTVARGSFAFACGPTGSDTASFFVTDGTFEVLVNE